MRYGVKCTKSYQIRIRYRELHIYRSLLQDHDLIDGILVHETVMDRVVQNAITLHTYMHTYMYINIHIYKDAYVLSYVYIHILRARPYFMPDK